MTWAIAMESNTNYTQERVLLSRTDTKAYLLICTKKSYRFSNKRGCPILHELHYTHLNSNTTRDAYPFAPIGEFLTTLGHTNFFSMFDITSGY